MQLRALPSVGGRRGEEERNTPASRRLTGPGADSCTFSMRPLVAMGSGLFFASGYNYQEAPVGLLHANGKHPS